VSPRVLWASTGLPGGIRTVGEVLRSSPLGARWSIEVVETHVAGSRAHRLRVFLRGAARYVRVLARERPALVHLHSAAHGSFLRKALLLWTARAFRVPVVLHVHSGDFVDFHERSPKPLQRFTRATLTGADRVIALGDVWAERMRGIAPRARIAAVGNPITLPAEVARPGDPPTVVFLGQIAEFKGVFGLLEAWADAVRDLPGGARLVLAGSGDTDRAQRDVARLGIGASVEMPGWVSAAEVRDLLAGADVLVLPSLGEGQPMSVLEAMAHGLCVVATSVGGVPEMLDGGAAGVLVPRADVPALAAALREVLTDPQRRRALGAAARARVAERHDAERVWRRFDALYRELAGLPAVAETPSTRTKVAP
jgi:glycosyltransferase involved in cell wall biosynthesis